MPDLKGEAEVSFNVEKVSERHVRKFGATSCVFRVTMAEKPETMNTIRVRDILEELDSLFTEAIG